MKKLYYEYVKKLFVRSKKKKRKFSENVKINSNIQLIVVDDGEFQVDQELLPKSSNFKIISKDIINSELYPYIRAWLGNIDKKEIKLMSNLEWLQIPAVGTNGYEKPFYYYDFKKVMITNLKGIFNIPIADYCCACISMISRKGICLTVLPGRMYPRNKLGFKDLGEMEVMIIGAGSIGREIAKRLKGLGLGRIYGIKRKIENNQDNFFDIITTMDNITAYLDKVDFVISTLPESTETNNIFDSSFFCKMNRNSIFINVGRGNSVNERDLMSVLRKRIISGAILDVTKHETKLPITLLDWTPGLILTKHRSYLSINNQKRKNEFVEKQIKAYINKEKLCNLIQ